MTYSVFYRPSSVFDRRTHWIAEKRPIMTRCEKESEYAKADEPATHVKDDITESGLERLKMSTVYSTNPTLLRRNALIDC